jgi:hypothetical protein
LRGEFDPVPPISRRHRALVAPASQPGGSVGAGVVVFPVFADVGTGEDVAGQVGVGGINADQIRALFEAVSKVAALTSPR